MKRGRKERHRNEELVSVTNTFLAEPLPVRYYETMGFIEKGKVIK